MSSSVCQILSCQPSLRQPARQPPLLLRRRSLPRRPRVLNRRSMHGTDLICDKCGTELGGEESFLSCAVCDFDLCNSCSGCGSSERAERAGTRTDASPAVDTAAPAKATRQPSAYALSRAAAKAARQTASATRAAGSKRRAQLSKVASMNSAKRARGRGSIRGKHGGKRKHDRGDSCERGSKRGRGRQ